MFVDLQKEGDELKEECGRGTMKLNKHCHCWKLEMKRKYKKSVAQMGASEGREKGC